MPTVEEKIQKALMIFVKTYPIYFVNVINHEKILRYPFDSNAHRTGDESFFEQAPEYTQ